MTVAQTTRQSDVFGMIGDFLGTLFGGIGILLGVDAGVDAADDTERRESGASLHVSMDDGTTLQSYYDRYGVEYERGYDNELRDQWGRAADDGMM